MPNNIHLTHINRDLNKKLNKLHSYLMITKLIIAITLISIMGIPTSNAKNTYCKLTVNGGIGINGPCDLDTETGEFTDGLLKTACRSGMETCNPQDLEVIRGGSFGHIVPKDGMWEFCWNEGGYTTINQCFQGLKQDRSCWSIPDEVVFCTNH